MIVVRVELHSARTGKVSELARMHITNVTPTERIVSPRHDYRGETFHGRSTRKLNMRSIQRVGRVGNYPRERVHVWNLVTGMLAAMGYSTGEKDAATRSYANAQLREVGGEGNAHDLPREDRDVTGAD